MRHLNSTAVATAAAAYQRCRARTGAAAAVAHRTAVDAGPTGRQRRPWTDRRPTFARPAVPWPCQSPCAAHGAADCAGEVGAVLDARPRGLLGSALIVAGSASERRCGAGATDVTAAAPTRLGGRRGVVLLPGERAARRDLRAGAGACRRPGAPRARPRAARAGPAGAAAGPGRRRAGVPRLGAGQRGAPRRRSTHGIAAAVRWRWSAALSGWGPARARRRPPAPNQNGLAVTRARPPTGSACAPPATCAADARADPGGPARVPRTALLPAGAARSLRPAVRALRCRSTTETQRVSALDEGVADVAVAVHHRRPAGGGRPGPARRRPAAAAGRERRPVVSARAVDRHGGRRCEHARRVSARLDTASLIFLNWRVERRGQRRRRRGTRLAARHGLLTRPADGRAMLPCRAYAVGLAGRGLEARRGRGRRRGDQELAQLARMPPLRATAEAPAAAGRIGRSGSSSPASSTPRATERVMSSGYTDRSRSRFGDTKPPCSGPDRGRLRASRGSAAALSLPPRHAA